MLFYIIIWGYFGFMALVNINRTISLKNNFFYVIISILSFFISFRVDVGIDWPNYVFFYENGYDMTRMDGALEPLFVLLRNCLFKVGFRYEVFFYIIAFFTLWSIYDAARRLNIDRLYLVFLIYISLFFCSFQFNIIRNSLMAACVWQGVSYIAIGKRKIACVWGIIGSGFHIVGLIFLPIIAISSMVFKKKCVYVLIFTSLAFMTTGLMMSLLSKLPLFSAIERLSLYVNNDSLEYGLSLGIFVNTFFFIYMFVRYRDSYENDLCFRVIVNMLLFSIIFCMAFNSFGVIVSRVGQTLNIALVYLWPLFFMKISNRYYRMLCFAFFVVYLFLYYNKAFAVNEGFGYSPIIPFKWEYHGLYMN